MMSLAVDSPIKYSNSSDDFAALIESALETLDSSEEEEEEELEFNDNENDTQVQSLKRRKVDEMEKREDHTLSHERASTDKEKCLLEGHGIMFKEMCTRCTQHVKDESTLALGYLNENLTISIEESVRFREMELKKMLRNKKLYLVLDLDHTLLNSTLLVDLSPGEEYLKSKVDSMQDIAKGSLFKLERMHMMTKLRPFVRTFLKEASSMYEMYIYTMAERSYALEMAHLLDPEMLYFNGKVVSQSDCTKKHKKGLDVVLGADSAVVILDDTEFVWSNHKENLILMDKYHFFASRGHQFKSLPESKRGENKDEGALANVLEVLKRIHHMFFDSKVDDDFMNRDVRQVLKTVRQEVLKGCRLVFSRVWKTGGVTPEELWLMAQDLGATCSTEYNSSVTHVVSMDCGTVMAKSALKDKKFLVHPRWIVAASYLWKRLPEDLYQPGK